MNGGISNAALRARITGLVVDAMERLRMAPGTYVIGKEGEHGAIVEAREHALRNLVQCVWVEVAADSMESILAMAREIEQLRREVADLREAVKQ